MPPILVTTEGITKLLKNLNTNKAQGPDKLPTVILKQHADLVAPILQVIFQQSLDTGTVPSDWQKADVVPVFKKGDKSKPENYRPVSLTCVTSKILEHILHSHILKHLDEHHILANFQHGFRKKHSCETQLLTTIENLARNRDKSLQTDLLILDFSKAFDTVPHQRLLYKLKYYGIHESTQNWIQSWLTHRTQRVVVDGEASTEAPVTSGVPQGTVLGPLMFLIYINDIGDNILSPLRLFADDALLYSTVSSVEDALRLQSDLHKLARWSDMWQMHFNALKCYLLRMFSHKTPILHTYFMKQTKLTAVEQNPYLGVALDKNLSWKPHIDSTCQKGTNALNFIKRNLWRCPPKLKETAYKVLVRPILEYAGTVWDPHHQYQIRKLEMVQRRAARFVKGAYTRDISVTQLLADLQWQPLQERRLIARLSLYHKAVNNTIAIDIPPYINPNSRQSRQAHPIQYTNIGTRTDIYKFSFFPRSTRAWNKLPADIVQQPQTDQFKTKLGEAFREGNILLGVPKDAHLQAVVAGTYSRPRLKCDRGDTPLVLC